MENITTIISALASFFKVLVAFLSMLGVTDEDSKAALDNLFNDVETVISTEE